MRFLSRKSRALLLSTHPARPEVDGLCSNGRPGLKEKKSETIHIHYLLVTLKSEIRNTM